MDQGNHPFAKLVPGFDFLQSMAKNAGAALPGMGQWIAPTLDPDELDKRIEQMKTVQFWLEQNARMVGATVQALEVQRMTLSTLKTMNLPVADLAEAFRIRTPEPAPDHAPAPAPAADPAFAPAAAAPGRRPERPKAAAPAPAPEAPPGVVDPMKWWGALTEQFGHLAAAALKDVGAAKPAAPAPAGAKPAARAAAPRKPRR